MTPLTPDSVRAFLACLNRRTLGHTSKPVTRSDIEVAALALNDWSGHPIDQDAFDAAGMPLEDACAARNARLADHLAARRAAFGSYAEEALRSSGA
jgi:hypothetical protein